jgi:hypothetical protein
MDILSLKIKQIILKSVSVVILIWAIVCHATIAKHVQNAQMLFSCSIMVNAHA